MTNISNPCDVLIEDQSLPALYELVDQHKIHLKFLEYNDICSPEKEKILLGKIKTVFDVITRRVENNSNKRPCTNLNNN